MNNAYPEKPATPFERTTVAMTDVITYLRTLPVLTEVRRASYIMFRNESANGSKGINNNYVGAQADSGRWPAQWDDRIAGVVTLTENVTKKLRLFVAFDRWETSVDFLADRVASRGLYVGGRTHRVLVMEVRNEVDLALAYHREWVTGSPTSDPSDAEAAAFASMYGQAAALFRDPEPPLAA